MRLLAEQSHTAPCFSLLVSQWEKNQEPLSQQEAAEPLHRAGEVDEKSQQRPEAARGQIAIAAADPDEENYFQEEDEVVQDVEARATGSAIGLVPYGDDEDEDGANNGQSIAQESGNKTAATGPSEGTLSLSSLTKVPEKRRRMEEDDDADDQLSRLSKRKSGRVSKNKNKADSDSKSPTEDEDASNSQSSGALFLRNMATTISKTFGGGSDKRERSRSPSPKRSKGSQSPSGCTEDLSASPKQGADSSPATSASPGSKPGNTNASKNGASGVGGLGIKRISLGLTGSSKKMAAQSDVRSTDKPEDEES